MVFLPSKNTLTPLGKKIRVQNHRVVALTLFMILISAIEGAIAQTPTPLVTTCPNSNFSTGTFDGWSGCYGPFNNSCNYPGFLVTPEPPFQRALHKIIQAPGWLDYNSCDSLPTVYPGEAFSARIGDTIQQTNGSGGKSAELRYAINVTEQTYLFIYRYAVLLQDFGHDPDEQPDFQVMITDEGGNVLDSTCGYYYIICDLANPGWHTCTAPATDVSWKEWTTVGINLTPYYGQTVYIKFKVRSCTYNTHFGCAYISAYCSHLTIQTGLCEGDTSATLTAPPGFSYLWSNGDTTQSTVVPNPTTGATYNCTLTSVNGCTVTINQVLTYTVINANFSHSSTCATLPVQFTDLSTINQNSVVDWKWDFDDGTLPLLHVQNPVHSFANSGTYNVKLIAYSTEGCTDTIIQQVEVDSLPRMNNSPHRKFICSDENTNITLTSTVTNSAFTWSAHASSPNVTGFSNNAVPTTQINQTLLNTGGQLDSVTYVITPHKGSCTGPDSIYTVIVYPKPILLNDTLSRSICDSTLTNILLERDMDTTRYTWTCSATSANLSGYVPNTTTPDTLINQRLRNNGFTVDTVIYHILPWAYGCHGDTIDFRVAVYPDPDVSNVPMTKSICDGDNTNILLTSHADSTTFTWIASGSSPLVTGFSNSTAPGTLISQLLQNNSTINQTVTYRIVPQTRGCPGDSVNFTVTVLPTPDLSNPIKTDSICDSTNLVVALQSNVTGTTFTWRAFSSALQVTGYMSNTVPATEINHFIRNTGLTTETVTYRIQPIANGCQGDSTDIIVTVFPQPDLSNPIKTDSICDSTAVVIPLQSNVAGAAFTWRAFSSTSQVTGYTSNTIPATQINQFIRNLSYEPQTITYRILPTANGCQGDSTDIVVTVFPDADISNPIKTDSICDSTNLVIPLQSNVAGTTFTWRAFSSTLQVSGYSSNFIPSTEINQFIRNNGYTTETVTYRILPSANGCQGDSTDIVVTVFPDADLSNPIKTDSICDSTWLVVPLQSNVVGTAFTWRAFSSSLQVTGYMSNTLPASEINQFIRNLSYEPQTITYRILPFANGCQGDSTDIIVTVFPDADLSNPIKTDSICDSTTVVIPLQSNIVGTNFTWRAFSSSLQVTGYMSNTVPVTEISQFIRNTGYTTETVTYRILPSANGCPGDSTDIIVTVFPTPDMSNSVLTKEICNNNNTNIQLTSQVSATLFTWTCTSSSPNLVNWSNSATPLPGIYQNLLNTGSTNETVTYHITPQANGCSGWVYNYVVTVIPSPYLTNWPLRQTQCNIQNTNLTLVGNVTGSEFTWTVVQVSGNITGQTPSSVPGTLISQVLTNSSYIPDSVTYLITPVTSGCPGSETDYDVVVYPIPDLSNPILTDSICDSTTLVIPLHSHVGGSTFTWRAFSSSLQVTGYSSNAIPSTEINQFIRNNGYTTETVTYRILPSANGCQGDSTDIIVTVFPDADLSNPIKTDSICDSTWLVVPFKYCSFDGDQPVYQKSVV